MWFDPCEVGDGAVLLIFSLGYCQNINNLFNKSLLLFLVMSDSKTMSLWFVDRSLHKK